MFLLNRAHFVKTIHQIDRFILNTHPSTSNTQIILYYNLIMNKLNNCKHIKLNKNTYLSYILKYKYIYIANEVATS